MEEAPSALPRTHRRRCCARPCVGCARRTRSPCARPARVFGTLRLVPHEGARRTQSAAAAARTAAAACATPAGRLLDARLRGRLRGRGRDSRAGRPQVSIRDTLRRAALRARESRDRRRRPASRVVNTSTTAHIVSYPAARLVQRLAARRAPRDRRAAGRRAGPVPARRPRCRRDALRGARPLCGGLDARARSSCGISSRAQLERARLAPALPAGRAPRRSSRPTPASASTSQMGVGIGPTARRRPPRDERRTACDRLARAVAAAPAARRRGRAAREDRAARAAHPGARSRTQSRPSRRASGARARSTGRAASASAAAPTPASGAVSRTRSSTTTASRSGTRASSSTPTSARTCAWAT